MALALLIFGVTFAAFCVWLTVRVVNRGQRWAKRTAVVLILLLAIVGLYGLSTGPAIYIAQSRGWTGRGVSVAYHPVILLLARGPRPMKRAIWWYLDPWIVNPTRFDAGRLSFFFFPEPGYSPRQIVAINPPAPNPILPRVRD